MISSHSNKRKQSDAFNRQGASMIEDKEATPVEPTHFQRRAFL